MLRLPIFPLVPLFVLGLLALGAAPAAAQDLTVSAAASLRAAMLEIAGAYEAAHPAQRVRLNVAGSNALLAQIEQGAPVDVFASADMATMDRAAARGLIVAETRRNVARNALVLVAPAGTGAPLRRLDDLTLAGVRRIGIGTPATVPAGRYARELLQSRGLWDSLRAKLVFAEDVRQVLNYVERGEVDAGFVYRSDALAAGARLRPAIELPDAPAVLYPIAVVKASRQIAAAGAFAAFVASTPAQAILLRHGFAAP